MIKKALCLSGTFMALICVCFLMILAAYSIPTDFIRENVRKSSLLLAEEGDYPAMWGQFYLVKDNFTDKIMYNETVSSYDYGIIDGAMLNPMTKCVDETDEDRYLTAEASIKICDGDTVAVERIFYGRYWHGYQLPLRVMSIFMPLSHVRVLNYMLLWGLLLVTGGLLWWRTCAKYAIGYVLSILAVGFVVVPMSLQFSTCFYIMFISVLVILCNPSILKSDIKSSMAFMAIGGCTVFFDFLTTPVLTLGMPIIIAFLINSDCGRVGFIVRKSIMWGLGYGGVWIFKWLLGSVLTGENILGDAYESAQWRSMCSVFTFTSESFDVLGQLRPILAGVFLFVVLPIVTTLLYRHCCKGRLRQGLFLYLTACMPIVWYFLLFNHSLIHYFFTYRSLSVWLFSIYLMVFGCNNSKSYE